MMKFLSIIIGMFLVLIQSLNGQSYQPLIKDVSTMQLSRDNFFEKMGASIGLSDAMQMIPIRTRKDVSGMIHITYEQRYQGIKMYGTRFLLHEKDNNIKQYSGTILPIPECSAIPTITQERAKQIAQYAFFNSDKAQVLSRTQYLRNSQKVKFNQTELVWMDKIFPLASNSTTLAWRLVIESNNPLKKREILLDAHDGHVIFSQSKIKQHNVPSKGVTHYYGEQSFQSDSISPGNFLLRDLERNITTHHAKSSEYQIVTNNSSYWNFKSKYYDEVAMDAHYSASKFYDMMLNTLDWKGVDGMGGAMNPVVQLDGADQIVNAFWTGENAIFGNGNCFNDPLTTLSIVGHEFMHGVTEHSANLIYSRESGALNEAYSDIFGKANEYYNDPSHFSWLLDSIIVKKYGRLFRSMKDPNSLKMPKSYQGMFWQDDADVHYNSSVLNHWFYLMVTGGSGISEDGSPYQINPQPMDKILSILFSTLADYMQPTSGYIECFEISKVVCANLYGNNSPIYQSMIEAWKAVGIETVINPIPVNNLGLIVPFNEDFSICANLGLFHLKYQILNKGNVALPTGTTLTVEVDMDGTLLDSIITLTQPLLPGTTLNKNFSIDISQLDPGFYPLSVHILEMDDDMNDNDDFAFFQLMENQTDDIAIPYAIIRQLNCTGPDFEITYYVSNEGCNTIPKGSIIHYTLAVNNTVILSKDAQVNVDDLNDQYFFIIDTITNKINHANVQLSVSYGNDTKPMNNKYDAKIEVGVYDQLFALDFSDETYLDVFNEYAIDPGTGIHRTAWNGEDYHINVGQSLFPEPNQYLPCPVIEDNFYKSLLNASNGYLEDMSTCLDLSAWNSTRLSVDVVQFRANDIQYPELNPLSSLLKISWRDNQTEKYQYVADQAEGQKMHYQIDLPKKYIGELKFEFYNRNRPDYQGMESELLERDAILIDNLRIEEISATVDPIYHQEIQLIPNPVHDEALLLIQSSKKYQVQIQDIQGRTIQTLGTIQNAKQISLDFLNPGIYQFTCMDESGGLQYLRFVKM